MAAPTSGVQGSAISQPDQDRDGMNGAATTMQ